MREIIKTTLQQWVEQFEKQQQQAFNMEAYDFYLDSHLLGVAKFLKEIAFSLDDVELLGISTKLEMYIEKKLDEESQAGITRMLELEYNHEFRENIRKICIKYFYTEPKFTVDMSKYKAEVEQYSEFFSDPKKLTSLMKYIDEKNVLDKIYRTVKNVVLYKFISLGKPPELKDLEVEFTTQLQDTYRRADEHVYKTLARYVRN